MSFSAEVKKEITCSPLSARHCQIAQIYAVMNNSAKLVKKHGETFFCVNTENEYLVRNFCFLMDKSFSIEPEFRVRLNKKSGKINYHTGLYDAGSALRVIKATVSPGEKTDKRLDLLLLKKDCCKRNYLKSSFISNASMSDPNKNYHLEFNFSHEENAKIVMWLLEYFSLKPRLIMRKKNYVAYLKDGEKISEFLGLIGAHNSLLYFENLRIFKTVGNEINRKVNCETANMAKTAKAFVSLQEDILLIERLQGLSHLSAGLREVVELRLEYPNATLKEIGELLNPPISKSGVNHRLRKVTEAAEKLRRDLYD